MAGIRGAENELMRNSDLYEDYFLVFYPELQTAAQIFIEQYN